MSILIKDFRRFYPKDGRSLLRSEQLRKFIVKFAEYTQSD